MTELVMRKQGTRLVSTCQMSDEDMASIPNDKDLLVTVKVPKNPKQLRFAWELAQKIADARDDILDKDVAMDVLCEMTRHVKMVVNPVSGHAFLMRKSLSNINGDEFSRLLNRMVYVTITQIIPGLDESDLRREIEAMVTGGRNQKVAA